MTCTKCIEQHLTIQRLHTELAQARERVARLSPPASTLAPVTRDQQDWFRRAVHAREEAA